MLSAQPCEGFPLLLMGPGMGRVPETPRCILTKVLWGSYFQKSEKSGKAQERGLFPRAGLIRISHCALGYVLSHLRVTMTLLQGKVCNHAHFPDDEKLRFRD